MSDVWIKCDIDLLQDDQVQVTYNQKDGSVDQQLIQNWVCETDGTTGFSSPTAALSAAVAGGNALPSAGELISEGGTVYQVTRVMPKRTGPYSFNVQVESHSLYTPPLANAKDNVSITFAGQKFTQDCYNDSTGSAIVNSAGQSFDPSLPQVYYDERISVSYVTASDQSATFATVRGKVCNASIAFAIQGVSRSFPYRGLLCEDVQQSASLPLSNGTPTFKVTAEFLSRADTYVENVLDQGFYQLSGGALTPILDANGNRVSTPVRLNGSGAPLASGSPPVYIPFKVEKEADFTSVFTGLS